MSGHIFNYKNDIRPTLVSRHIHVTYVLDVESKRTEKQYSGDFLRWTDDKII